MALFLIFYTFFSLFRLKLQKKIIIQCTYIWGTDKNRMKVGLHQYHRKVSTFPKLALFFFSSMNSCWFPFFCFLWKISEKNRELPIFSNRRPEKKTWSKSFSYSILCMLRKFQQNCSTVDFFFQTGFDSFRETHVVYLLFMN